MKYVFIIILFLCLTLACKKKPFEESFLYGKLIDKCNGEPVIGQTVQFYQNFKKNTSILQSDTETKLLEEAKTDENGYFRFTGEGYTKSSTSNYSNSSVRLKTNIYLASGHLGKGKAAIENEDIFVHNIGNVLLNGMSSNTNFKIATGNYDSVKISSVFYNINMTLSTIQNGYFIENIANQKLTIKNFWGNENDSKYNLYLKFEFYYNSGQLTTPVYYDYFFDQCASSIEIVYEH